ncbi:LuxR family two component transcriptional regulator [Microbacterium sp. AG790]|uniref:response regulator transcription factor n=1 Tax=Microbacterium sp. AG790 TaxID=2183995 RepID=UPI000EB201C8|nr:response regulator transcription factor [Microbacterium sp. AG790]RKS85699.1 LuxR family two component transcriptional regulator [Microbacterium sp. AG790]
MVPKPNGRPPERVLIVDDDPIVRSALRLALSGRSIIIVGEAQHGAQALQMLESGVATDVILMDIWTPTISGIAAAGPIGSRFPHLRIILMTNFLSNDLLPHIATAGVHGCLLKSAGIDEMIAAIHGAESAVTAAEPPVELSVRERQIIALIGLGSSNRRIAETLELTVSTVKTYIARLYTKLGVHNRVQLVRAARETNRVGAGEFTPSSDGRFESAQAAYEG